MFYKNCARILHSYDKKQGNIKSLSFKNLKDDPKKAVRFLSDFLKIRPFIEVITERLLKNHSPHLKLGSLLLQLLIYETSFGRGVSGQFRSVIKRYSENIVEEMLLLMKEMEIVHLTSSSELYEYLSEKYGNEKNSINYNRLIGNEDDKMKYLYIFHQNRFYDFWQKEYKDEKIIDNHLMDNGKREEYFKKRKFFIDYLTHPNVVAIPLSFSLKPDDSFMIMDRSSILMSLSSLYKNGLYHFNYNSTTTTTKGRIEEEMNEGFFLDLCSAPGNKSIVALHLNKKMKKIYLNDLNKGRLEMMKKRINKLIDQEIIPSDKINYLNMDASKISLKRKDVSGEAEYLFLDPTCSGSGIFSFERANDESWTDENYIDRCKQLSKLQTVLLKNALTQFPNGKTLTYSTCSLHWIENEQVILNVRECAEENGWQLQNILDDIKNDVGMLEEKVEYKKLTKTDKSYLKNVVRFTPAAHHCNGFFIAKFIRINRSPTN